LGGKSVDMRIISNILKKVMRASLHSYTGKALVKAAINIRNRKNV